MHFLSRQDFSPFLPSSTRVELRPPHHGSAAKSHWALDRGGRQTCMQPLRARPASQNSFFVKAPRQDILFNVAPHYLHYAGIFSNQIPPLHARSPRETPQEDGHLKRGNRRAGCISERKTRLGSVWFGSVRFGPVVHTAAGFRRTAKERLRVRRWYRGHFDGTRLVPRAGPTRYNRSAATRA